MTRKQFEWLKNHQPFEVRYVELYDGTWVGGCHIRSASFIGEYLEVKTLRDSSTGSWDRFTKYTKNLPDNYHQLDEKIAFQDTVVKREDYISKRLPYSLKDGDISAYTEMMTVSI